MAPVKTGDSQQLLCHPVVLVSIRGKGHAEFSVSLNNSEATEGGADQQQGDFVRASMRKEPERENLVHFLRGQR